MTAGNVISRQLDDIAAIVMSIDDATYVARPIAEVSGSIGEHVRHCLDHIGALVAAGASKPLSYDRRGRGTAVERDPAEALRLIMRLKSAVDRWGERAMDEPLCVLSMLTVAGDTVTGWSTLGRELAFVNSHTIHHEAMIAVLLSLAGLDIPDRLGLAPATPTRHSGTM
jgi:uncharacterized damage-inducible protein DinB